jgi:hypothetical protein
MSKIQNVVIGLTVAPTAFGFFNYGGAMLTDLETFYFACFAS